MFGWYPIVANNFWGSKKSKTFPHLSLSKAGPFTLESHIFVKAFKCKDFQTIRCLIKPLIKNSIQTIFQGGTSWVAQLLNNMNVWMVLHCAQQLLGLKKIKSKLKSIESKLFSIESKLKSIKSKLKSIENQLKVNWFQLKVNWFQLKPLLKLTIQKKCWGGGGKKTANYSVD